MSDGVSIAFAGVTLEGYAGVSAAVADEIPLDDVLKQEGITADAWSTAKLKWTELIAESPDLQVSFRRAYAKAEDTLTRKIHPVDSDVMAYIGLNAMVRESKNLMEGLKGLGLRPADLGRLARAWRKKAKSDPEVAKVLADTSSSAPHPKKVETEPAKLKPFPWTKGATKDAASAQSSGPTAISGGSGGGHTRLSTLVGGQLPVETDVDLYAALSVVSQLMPADKATWLNLCGLDPKMYDGLVARWQERLEANQELRATFSMHAGEHRRALRKMLDGASAVLD